MYHIIVNPASRSGKGKTIWAQSVEPALKKENISYQVYFSNAAGDVSKIAKQITSTATDCPLQMIVLGGDGTVNELLQGINPLSDITLGYIPTGSSNDLARDLGIPKNPTEALHMILSSPQSHSIDMGQVTFSDGSVRRFAVSCGIGFDAAVCEEVLHSKLKSILNKIGLGKLTYLGIALKQLFAAPEVTCTLTLDQEPPLEISHCLFITGMLHRFEGGGFQFCPTAVDNDGKLNICAVGSIPKWLILLALPTAFWGKHYLFSGINAYETGSYHIKASEPLWIHTDGEVCQKSDSFTVECFSSNLRLITRASS